MKMTMADTLTGYVDSTIAWPVKNFDTKEIIKDEQGLATYPVKILHKSPGGKSTEQLEINVKAKTNPFEGLECMDAVTFKNIQISFGIYNGKKYWKLSADSVKKA